MSRTEFEDAVLTTHGITDLRVVNGCYVIPTLQRLWEGWQMARKMPAEFQPLADHYATTELHGLVLAQSQQIDKLLARLPSNSRPKVTPPKL